MQPSHFRHTHKSELHSESFGFMGFKNVPDASSDLNFLKIVVRKVLSHHAIFNVRKYLSSNFTDYFDFFKKNLTYSFTGFLCLQVVQHQSLQKCWDYLAFLDVHHSHQAIIRQLSCSCQAVIRQPSDSQQAVIMQSSGSQQAVIRQLLDSHSCSVFLVSCC